MTTMFPHCDEPGCRRGRHRWSRFCDEHFKRIVSSRCPECGSEFHLLCNRSPVAIVWSCTVCGHIADHRGLSCYQGCGYCLRERAKAEDRAFLEHMSEKPELEELEKHYLDGDR